MALCVLDKHTGWVAGWSKFSQRGFGFILCHSCFGATSARGALTSIKLGNYNLLFQADDTTDHDEAEYDF